MDTLIVLVRGCSIGIYLVLSMKLYVDCRQLLAGRLLLALILCSMAYLLEPYLPSLSYLERGVRLLTVMVTPLIWLFASALFLDWDHQQKGVGRGRLIISACFMAVVCLEMILEYGFPGRWELAQTVVYYISYLFRLAILTAALVVTLAHWRQDMIEARRKLRLLIVSAGVSLTILTTTVEMGYVAADTPEMLTLVQAMLVLILTLWTAAWLLFASPDGLTVIAGKPVCDEKSTSLEPRATRTIPMNDERLLALNDFMVNQKGYRITGLTIGGLGKEMKMPEHVLRKLINRGLGYRNFSDFLNFYRIKDAASRLADPSQAHMSILTIAMDAGYASLAPFNRAFKEKKRQTPSEYRKQQSAAAEN